MQELLHATWRSRLWRRYAAVMVALSVTVIGGFGAMELGLSFDNARSQALRVQDVQAGEAAFALNAALVNIDRHVGAVSALPWSDRWLGLDTRREEFARLLRLVPAVESVRYRDASGVELLTVSRRRVDVLLPRPDAAASASVSASAPASSPVASASASAWSATAALASASPASPASPASAASAAAAASTPPAATVYFEDSEPFLDLRMPDAAGGGMTLVRVGMRALARELRTALTLQGAEVYAVDAQGLVALHRDPLVMLSRVRAASMAGAASEAASALPTSPLASGGARGRRGGEVLRATVPVDRLGWTVVVERPRADVLAPAWATVWRTAAFLALGVLLAVLAALLLAGRLTRPIRQLHQAAAQVAAGRLDTSTQIRTGDELEDLSNQFNQMAQSLQASVNELEAKVSARTADLERATRHKSDFLANMSHELRTPLNAILGFADVLREGMAGPLNADQQEHIADIHASGLHLLSLINDVLDLSKIEAGQLDLETSEFDVPETLNAAVALVRQRAVQKGLQLRVDVQPELADHALWTADARRFKQVVLNLLSNAVKFTSPGGQVGLQAGLDDAEGLWVQVQDSGIGIAPADHAAVFEEFRQVGAPRAGAAERAEGTGLGLALVRRLVEQHGGRVTLHSDLGQGATFRFNIPRDLPERAA